MNVQCQTCGLVIGEEEIRLSAPEYIDNILQPPESKCTSCGAIDSFEPLNNNED